MNHVRKLVVYVKPYWKRSVAALMLLTTLVFLDLSIPRLIQHIIDQGILQHNQTVVVQTALLMIGLSVVSTVIAIGNNNLSVQVGESVARDIREALFLKIQTFSYGNLDRQQTGQLMVRLTSDTSAFQRLVQVSLRIGTRAPLLMLGSLILMFNTSPQLAMTLLPLLLITTVLIVFFIVKMEPLFRTVQQKLDRLNTVLQENIAGVRVVKSFVRAEYEGERFEGANEAYTAHSERVMRFMSTMSPVLTVCVNIGLVMVVWIGGQESIQGDLSVGQIVAFTNYLLTTMTPLIMMTLLSNVWANGIASAKRINEVLDTVPEVQDAPQAKSLPETTQGQITFENVAFHYNGHSAEEVLEGVMLKVEAGKTLAILGATGAGKTSLINLVPRFYDVKDGRILIDGVDIREVQQDSLLAHIAIVPQETVLFSGTVRDNIRYGCPDANDDEVIAAAKAAQAHDFIMALPQGYDSRIEERGTNLSGGQKQRVAIARALLMKPRILILDDSTSSVDVETETKIQDALAAQHNRHTTLVVAQRISTVLKADKIVVIDEGRIAAEGTHAELMQSSPIYQEIYESQLGNGFKPSAAELGEVWNMAAASAEVSA
ncbi:MAG: ABC transporter ATP-binding protein [Anaerolineae bacterium]